MTVIDRPWLFRDDDGVPRFKTTWLDQNSRRSSYWPGPRERKEFEAHDAQTRVLMKRFESLYGLVHGEVVVPLIEEWQWLDHMGSTQEKQRYLEPLIERVRRSPDKNPGLVVFLLLVCEGTRVGAASQLLSARSGLDGSSPAPGWHRREEARRLQDIERDRLHDVTRQATLEALYRCPTPFPLRFFGWLRETISHRTLDFLRAELAEVEIAEQRVEEGEALQAFLAGLQGAEAPASSERGGFDQWYHRVRPLYANVAEYSEIAVVRQVCRTAIRRLPPKQQAVIDELFYVEREAAEIAANAGVARSTIYNTKAQALRNLHEDDCFFMALYGMRLVRDAARRQQLLERHPDGRLPDGRRLVLIEAA